MLTVLPRIIPSPPDRPEVGNADHPMRKVTRQVAFEPDSWTPERAQKVGELFDTLAPDWHTRFTDDRQDPILDALERGEVHGRMCLEVGGGIGHSTALLAERCAHVLTADLSWEMLTRMPDGAGHRMQADSARLPIPDAGIDVVLLENMLLFPGEIARILSPTGALVWVNSLGDATPIHLPAEDVLRALPGNWSGVTSDAGWGLWCVARRSAH